VPAGPYINAQVHWIDPKGSPNNSPLASPTEMPREVRDKIDDHFKQVPEIFKQCTEKSITVRNVWSLGRIRNAYASSNQISPIIAAEVDTEAEASSDMIRIMDGKVKNFPEINAVIIYVVGDYFGTNANPNSLIEGLAFRDSSENPCYLILLSERANAYILAHEIGHILNYSNINGLTLIRRKETQHITKIKET
jgi:hypothetical protein